MLFPDAQPMGTDITLSTAVDRYFEDYEVVFLFTLDVVEETILNKLLYHFF